MGILKDFSLVVDGYLRVQRRLQPLKQQPKQLRLLQQLQRQPRSLLVLYVDWLIKFKFLIMQTLAGVI